MRAPLESHPEQSGEMKLKKEEQNKNRHCAEPFFDRVRRKKARVKRAGSPLDYRYLGLVTQANKKPSPAGKGDHGVVDEENRRSHKFKDKEL